MAEHRGREIPWLSVVQFHHEIATRAEQGFFSLYAKDAQDERWSSLTDFEPETMPGPWGCSEEVIRSKTFLQAIELGQHESLFLGGAVLLSLGTRTEGKLDS